MTDNGAKVPTGTSPYGNNMLTKPTALTTGINPLIRGKLKDHPAQRAAITNVAKRKEGVASSVNSWPPATTFRTS